jgi:hypothetical protein
MSGKFDAYEYVGVIAPGSIAIFGAAWLYPDLRQLIVGTDVSLGGLGLFVIMSYVAGHLLQALGNIVEWAMWLVRRGMPTDWVLTPDQKIIAPPQAEKLFRLLKSQYPDFAPSAKDAKKAWKPIVRELYACVKKADQSYRIDAFNRTYGLLRGISAGFILVLIVIAFRKPDIDTVLLLGACAILALARMYHFGVLYGRELLVTYVMLDSQRGVKA